MGVPPGLARAHVDHQGNIHLIHTFHLAFNPMLELFAASRRDLEQLVRLRAVQFAQQHGGTLAQAARGLDLPLRTLRHWATTLTPAALAPPLA